MHRVTEQAVQPLQERRCTLVEFLREARDALGTDLLMQAMVSNRTNTDKVRCVPRLRAKIFFAFLHML
jgi:hypothetical protein